MSKKHFICTHTWLNEDAKKAGTEATSNMTEKEFFDSVKTDKAETLAHWMSKEDLFFAIGTLIVLMISWMLSIKEGIMN